MKKRNWLDISMYALELLMLVAMIVNLLFVYDELLMIFQAVVYLVIALTNREH